MHCIAPSPKAPLKPFCEWNLGQPADSACQRHWNTHIFTQTHIQYEKLDAVGFVTKQQSRSHGSVCDAHPCVLFGQRPIVSHRYVIVASLAQAHANFHWLPSTYLCFSELLDCLMQRMTDGLLTKWDKEMHNQCLRQAG